VARIRRGFLFAEETFQTLVQLLGLRFALGFVFFRILFAETELAVSSFSIDTTCAIRRIFFELRVPAGLASFFASLNLFQISFGFALSLGLVLVPCVLD
jgi:hypothetical protein